MLGSHHHRFLRRYAQRSRTRRFATLSQTCASTSRRTLTARTAKDTIIIIPNSVSSTYTNLSLSVPVTCRGFVGTFIKQSEEKNPIINSLACQNIPSLAKLPYLYNNATTNAQITYQITDIKEELKNRFTEALSSSYHSMFSPPLSCKKTF